MLGEVGGVGVGVGFGAEEVDDAATAAAVAVEERGDRADGFFDVLGLVLAFGVAVGRLDLEGDGGGEHWCWDVQLLGSDDEKGAVASGWLPALEVEIAAACHCDVRCWGSSFDERLLMCS